MSGKSGSKALLPELFSVSLYKANQGRMVRQFTFFGIAVLAAFGCITLGGGPLMAWGQSLRVAIPLVLWGLTAWVAFRAIHYVRFADFLIAVEAELLRVTWPARQEVVQATIVVVVTMFCLGAFLFLVDLVWQVLFRTIGFNEM